MLRLMVYFAAAALFGALVGLAELISRYRDAPTQAVWCVPAGAYLAINAAASAIALAIVQGAGWNFGVVDAQKAAWIQTAVAGFGSMTLFRSSLFVVHVGGQDVGAGPSAFLQVALGAADRAVDRRRAGARAARVQALMQGVNFGKASITLPTYCLALMQNLGMPEQREFRIEVDRVITSSQMDDSTKLLTLGLLLMNVVGEAALSAAIRSLGAAIR
jgi:hypothetical protein